MNAEPKTILIVDEDPAVRQTVREALDPDGYRFLTAANGTVAFAKAKSQAPDAIVMDVQMPKRDGLSALYDLRHDAATQAIPVIILTGVGGETGVRFTADNIEEFMGERPDACLDLPVDPEVLRETLRGVLSG